MKNKGLNLKQIAIDLLMIEDDFYYHFNKKQEELHSYGLLSFADFSLETFEQCWGNTSGGFEGIGGSAMTVERTYVFLPEDIEHDDTCFVYFNGAFGYEVPYSDRFMEDVKNRNIKGCRSNSIYFE